jgi:DNA-directed RNA polymerase subunit alpha
MDQNNLWTGFQMPRRLAADAETLTERYGRFSAQPFERGFGTTVGNSLRRALLSSIEGAAITAVKIEGVEHEFSSIKGVVEDATDVILNLKQVPFKLHSSEPKTLRINKEEAGEVTAADIETDADVEILDPTVHIATVSEGGSLKVEMRLKRGVVTSPPIATSTRIFRSVTSRSIRCIRPSRKLITRSMLHVSVRTLSMTS